MNLILFEKEECIETPGGTLVRLQAEDARTVHLRKVLKAKPGSEWDAGIINGPRGRVELTALSKTSAEMIFRPAGSPEGLHPLTLIIGLSRPQTMRKVLKECSALGVRRFLITSCDRSEKSYAEAGVLKRDSLRRLFIEGAQQAFCTMLPEAVLCTDIREAVQLAAGSRHLLAMDNYEAEMPLSGYWPGTGDAGETILAVGSERGWSGRERYVLREAGFSLCSAGRRVLRTETAAVAGCALCLSGMGLI